MNITEVITKARDIYKMDGVLIPDPSGATEGEGGYWVDAFVWVAKDEKTELPPYTPTPNYLRRLSQLRNSKRLKSKRW